MKSADREKKRIQAELRDAPLHLLITMNNICTQFIIGLQGGGDLHGVNIMPIQLKKKHHKKWCLEQLARIISWNAACLERYGFKVNEKYRNLFWEEGQKRVNALARAVRQYASHASYEEQCLVHLIVAETAWTSCRVIHRDNSREAKYLSSTLNTFTSKFCEEDDAVSWMATDVYMAAGPILNGSEPFRMIDFEHLPAWSKRNAA